MEDSIDLDPPSRSIAIHPLDFTKCRARQPECSYHLAVALNSRTARGVSQYGSKDRHPQSKVGSGLNEYEPRSQSEVVDPDPNLFFHLSKSCRLKGLVLGLYVAAREADLTRSSVFGLVGPLDEECFHAARSIPQYDHNGCGSFGRRRCRGMQPVEESVDLYSRGLRSLSLWTLP